MDYPVITKPKLEDIQVRPNIGEYHDSLPASAGRSSGAVSTACPAAA